MWNGESVTSEFVEIHGVEDAEEIRGYADADPNGLRGRASAYCGSTATFKIETFEGYHLQVPEENLMPFQPVGPSEAGFDIAWPGSVEAEGTFKAWLVETLAHKGYCVIQTFEPHTRRERLLEEVIQQRRYRFSLPEQELQETYLGHGPLSSKVMFLEGSSGFEGDLAHYVGYLEEVSWLLSQDTSLGFSPCPESEAWMLRRSFKSRQEAQDMALQTTTLDERDVEDGLVERFLDFVHRRKICMMFFIESGESVVELDPRPGFDFEKIQIPMGMNKLLLFRHDVMSYSLKSSREYLVLQSWSMDQPQTLVMEGLKPEAERLYLEKLGKVVGPAAPQGYHVHIMSLETDMGGGAVDDTCYWSMHVAGVDGSMDIPMLRWDHSQYYDPDMSNPVSTFTRHATFLATETFCYFDYEFFGVPGPDEDVPQVTAGSRAVLTTGTKALYKAGFTRETLRGAYMASSCGIGESTEGYDDGTNKTQGYVNGVRNYHRLAHIFGMVGPTYQVDTACHQLWLLHAPVP
jgi:polyketide synthase-associated protein